MLEAIQKNSNSPKKVALLSFTGKAASRLEESLDFLDLAQIDANHFQKENVFLRISTIHSVTEQKGLLLQRGRRTFFVGLPCFRRGIYDRLSFDRATFRKNNPRTQLVLVGDSLQLHPIEVGYFFFGSVTMLLCLLSKFLYPKKKFPTGKTIPIEKGRKKKPVL